MKYCSYRGLALLGLGAVLSACSDDPSGPDRPNLRGTYTADWTYMFTAGVFGTFTAECTGTVTITEQDDEEFSGSFTTSAAGEDCEASSGTVEGEIRTDGGLNFTIDTPGTDDELEALTGCDVISADNQLNGTFVNNVITADADAVLDCPTDFGVLRVALELEVVATKN